MQPRGKLVAAAAEADIHDSIKRKRFRVSLNYSINIQLISVKINI